MTITCGTDFSDDATHAASVAALFAARLGVPLKLVHVFDELGAELTFAEGKDAIYDPVRARLHAEAERLRAEHRIEIEEVAVPGITADKLVELAAEARSTVLVVGAVGRELRNRWLLGSVAERVAQASAVPVLIIREASSLLSWARGGRPLRIMVGVEPTSTSRAALRWATNLQRLAPCELLVTQIVWPPGEHRRLGIEPPVPLDQLRPEIEQAARRDLERWAGSLPASSSFLVRPGWGKVASHLAQLAQEHAADLVIVGTHQRARLARLWQGSVSRNVLHEAEVNVACVPPAAIDVAPELPRFGSVLAPTDFSAFANRAIPVAYGLVGRGGHVHLLHVAESSADDTGAEQRLRALVPPSAVELDIETSVEIVAANDAGPAIAQAAARLGVDAVCMATHGRSGVASVLVGSQAQDVLRRCRQPVVLIPPERDG